MLNLPEKYRTFRDLARTASIRARRETNPKWQHIVGWCQFCIENKLTIRAAADFEWFALTKQPLGPLSEKAMFFSFFRLMQCQIMLENNGDSLPGPMVNFIEDTLMEYGNIQKQH